MSFQIRRRIVAITALAGALLASLPVVSQAVPSFARQANTPCVSCHTIFPALTPFGRQFKLNGYVLNAGETLTSKEEGKKPGTEESVLTLGKLPPVSVMFLGSWTSTHRMDPAAEHNGDILIPDQFSLFLAGQIGEKAGAFIQVTYTSVDDHFSWDNTDIRAADHATFGGKDFLYGVSLNNNPTIQDVWNSTPAWGFPYASSGVAPGPAAGSAVVDGVLGQQVAGLNFYTLWNNLLYTELGFYHAAPLATPRPLSGTSLPPATNIVEGVAPYGRVAVQQQWGEHYLMVGAYAMRSEIMPGGGAPLTGSYNIFSDWAMDLQYEKPFGKSLLTVHATSIHERQNFEYDSTLAIPAANPFDRLNMFRADANYYINGHYAMTVGYFDLTGTNDSLRYTGNVTGGSPDTRGAVLELAWVPYLNTKFAFQYTAYDKFDGAAQNYDGAGRSAHDNNTTFIYAWLIF